MSPPLRSLSSRHTHPILLEVLSRVSFCGCLKVLNGFRSFTAIFVMSEHCRVSSCPVRLLYSLDQPWCDFRLFPKGRASGLSRFTTKAAQERGLRNCCRKRPGQGVRVFGVRGASEGLNGDVSFTKLNLYKIAALPQCVLRS